MDLFQCTEVDAGSFFAGEMFNQAFGHDIPDWGYHLVCFYRASQERFVPVTYVNFAPSDNVILVGGGNTNRKAFEHVDPEHAKQLRAMGGGLFQILTFGFKKFADQYDAFFGYAGNPRALEVDLAAGFELTQYKYLIVNFHKPLSESTRQALIEKVYKLGPF